MFVINWKYIVVLTGFFILGMCSLSSQELSNYSNSRLKYLANEAEAVGDHMTAAEFFEELSRRKPKNENFKYSLARSLHQSSQFNKARALYAELAMEHREKFPLAAFYQGRLLIMEGNCEAAVPILEQFRKDYRGEKEDRKYRRMAQFSVRACTEASFEKDGNLLVQPLPSEINGSNMEGAPLFESKDRIIYSSLKADPNKVFESGEPMPEPKYFIGKRENGNWKVEGEWQAPELPKGYVAVSGTFNPTKDRFYLSACKDLHTAQMQCNIFVSEFKNSKWSAAKDLSATVNSSAQDRHPAVGYDEKGRETLYFVSDREEGKGGYDIWYSTYYEKKDEYREAKNCGSKVNSVGDELSPYIDPESGTLYFSSDGHPGLGGQDVFRSAGSRSKWMEPTNLGSGINGPMDELYYVLDPSGQSGMFVSNRIYGNKKQPCCDDLFYFTDPDLIRLNYTGTLLNEEGRPLDKAGLLLYELDDSTGERFLKKRMITNEQGEFKFRLEPNKKYELKAEKEGYFAEKERLSTLGNMSSRDYDIQLRLKEMSDKAFVLENIYYGFNEAALTERAITAIDTGIYEILIENPSIIVEIGSHTDSKGRAAYNANLSQQRAESVVKYLIKRGISKDRLKAKGYGETLPVAPNTNEDGSDNPDGRALNRRTEFKVIGKIELREEED